MPMPGCNCPMCNPGGRDAHNRAMLLLLSFLDQRQQEQLRLTGHFTVVGSAGGVYEIYTNDYSGNVVQYQGERPYRHLCCYPRFPLSVPIGDYVLGQVLALKTDEFNFLATAH